MPAAMVNSSKDQLIRRTDEEQTTAKNRQAKKRSPREGIEQSASTAAARFQERATVRTSRTDPLPNIALKP